MGMAESSMRLVQTDALLMAREVAELGHNGMWSLLIFF